jgi:hypothetical protein
MGYHNSKISTQLKSGSYLKLLHSSSLKYHPSLYLVSSRIPDQFQARQSPHSTNTQGVDRLDKCRVNGRKCKNEVSSSILTPIYPCPMLAGCVDAPGGYRGSRRESTPCHASTRTTSCRFLLSPNVGSLPLNWGILY